MSFSLFKYAPWAFLEIKFHRKELISYKMLFLYKFQTLTHVSWIWFTILSAAFFSSFTHHLKIFIFSLFLSFECFPVWGSKPSKYKKKLIGFRNKLCIFLPILLLMQNNHMFFFFKMDKMLVYLFIYFLFIQSWLFLVYN